MKFVTFVPQDGSRRSGVLIDDGHKIVDLQARHVSRRKREEPALSSVLSYNALRAARAQQSP